MSLYQIGFGKLSFSTNGFSLSAFAVTPPYVRKLVSKAYPAASMAVYPATTHKLNGALYAQQIELPEGVIIQVQASRTYRGGRAGDGVLFIRTRESAALRQVMALLPAGEGSLLGQRFVAFGGNFDILNLEELNLAGILPHAGVVNGYMNDDEIDELFTVVEIAPEREAKPEAVVISTPDGGATTLFVAPTPKRRIRVR